MRKIDKFKNKKIAIYGFGRSGKSVYELLKNFTQELFITDDNKLELSEEYEKSFYSVNDILKKIKNGEIDILVVSPGLKPTSRLILEAIDNKVYVFGDVEVAYHFSKGKILVVTGTNGKTTTTTLLYNMIRDGFSTKKVFVGGNIGIPFSEVVRLTDDESITVLEISSFQAHFIEDFHPDLITMVNITPDHLLWHGNFENYINDKFNLLKNMSKKDYFIYNINDKNIVEKLDRVNCKLIPFATDRREKIQFFYDEKIVYADNKEFIHSDELKIRGIHNIENSLAAIASAIMSGVNQESIRKSLKEFEGVEHRLESVLTINGVEFINDSKATNVVSAITAIRAMERPFHIIMGGSEKDEDFSVLKGIFQNSRVKSINLTGGTAERMKKEIDLPQLIRNHNSFKEAIYNSFERAESGEVVLLSPGCASFDSFKNFEVRGKVFKEIVSNLATNQ